MTLYREENAVKMFSKKNVSTNFYEREFMQTYVRMQNKCQINSSALRDQVTFAISL